jgi:diadenosine tetraphosphate (Ap4A) HIT family hydrolase
MKRKRAGKQSEVIIKYGVENYIPENYPWRDPIKDNGSMVVYKDSFPVSAAGHYLYVPKTNDMDDVAECLIAAVRQGVQMVDEEHCDGFNVGINYGEAAGQTVMWPHIHLILRKNGDCENPKGGVRHVIPGKGDYTQYESNTSDS